MPPAVPNMPQIQLTVGTLLGVLCGLYLVYVAHEGLQWLYYKECRATLFRVMVYSNTDFCKVLAMLVGLVEMKIFEVLRQVLTGAMGGA